MYTGEMEADKMQLDKDHLRIIKWCLGILLAIPIVLFLWYVSDATKSYHYPTGQWYCEELQIQIGLGEEMESYAIIDGKHTECTASIAIFRPWIALAKANEDGVVHSEDSVFSGEIVSINALQIVIEEDDTNVQYSFLRVLDDGG